MSPEPEFCPCGAGASFARCCGPFIARTATPATAEQLMRSRYSAYARRHIDWIEATSTGTARAAFNRASATQWANHATFTALRILRTTSGGVDDVRGTVEFEATFQEDGETHTLHEVSLFTRDHGIWHYAGVAPAAKALGRNAPCACGSGKKSKRCCSP